MLILSRNAGESVIIGDAISVTVLRTHGSVVSIGITAPKEISVHRAEIHARIHGAAEDRVQPGQSGGDTPRPEPGPESQI